MLRIRKDNRSSKVKSGISDGDESEQPLIFERIMCITLQYVKGM